HAERHRRRAPTFDARRLDEGARAAVLEGGGDGQGLRERGGGPGVQRGGTDPRGLRLRPRVRRRAPPTRRTRDDDLRGNERDPARGHREERDFVGPPCLWFAAVTSSLVATLILVPL